MVVEYQGGFNLQANCTFRAGSGDSNYNNLNISVSEPGGARYACSYPMHMRTSLPHHSTGNWVPLCNFYIAVSSEVAIQRLQRHQTPRAGPQFGLWFGISFLDCRLERNGTAGSRDCKEAFLLRSEGGRRTGWVWTCLTARYLPLAIVRLLLLSTEIALSITCESLSWSLVHKQSGDVGDCLGEQARTVNDPGNHLEGWKHKPAAKSSKSKRPCSPMK